MRENYYTKLYHNILEEKSLNLCEKVIYSIIDSYCQAYDICFISNKKLASTINVSELTIKRAIKHLKDKHYISTWKLKKDNKQYRAITTNKSIFEDKNELNKFKREIHKKIELFDYDWLNERD